MFQTSVFLMIFSITNGLAEISIHRTANFAKQGMIVFRNSSSKSLISLQNIVPSDEIPFLMENEEPNENSVTFLVEGDIIVSKDFFGKRKKRRIISSKEYGLSTRWPDGIIPYEFDFDTDALIKNNSRLAMDHWHQHTCLRFEPYSPRKHSKHKSKLLIQNKGHCAARVGYSFDPRSDSISQSDIFLPSHCPFGTAVHELGHVIGFRHEHTRTDRDLHVKVNYEKIHPSLREQYSIMNNPEIGYYGVYYDLFSIMHYSNQGDYLESIDDKRSFLMGQRTSLSFSDIKLANLAYNCSGGCSKYLSCNNDGFLNSNCTCVCPDGLKGDTCDQIDDQQPTIPISSHPNLNCSFEFDFCDWIQDKNRDFDDWIRNTTFLKNYLLQTSFKETEFQLEKSSFIQLNLIEQNKPYVNSILISPVMEYSRFEFNCLSFYLKMIINKVNDSSFSKISVSLRDSGGFLRLIWSKDDFSLIEWDLVEIDLIMEPPMTMIIIEAEAFLWTDGEFLLDNIKFYRNSCKNVRKSNESALYSEWSDWSDCGSLIHNQCGFNLLGIQKRFRNCLYDTECTENLEESRNCLLNISCPNLSWLQSEWSPWSEWSLCSAKCKLDTNSSIRTRYRTCLNYEKCTGESIQIEECDVPECAQPRWSDWTSWTACSTTCGNGWKQRTRFCFISNIVVSNSLCNGSSVVSIPCFERECARKWSKWSEWSECSKSCGDGLQSRRRICVDGNKCTGKSREYRTCNKGPCERLLYSEVLLKCYFDGNPDEKCNIYHENWREGRTSYGMYGNYEIRYLFASPAENFFNKAFINTGLLRPHNGACLSFLIKNSDQNVGVFQVNRILLKNNINDQIYQEILTKNTYTNWRYIHIYLEPSDAFYLQFQLSISWSKKNQHFAVDDILVEEKDELACKHRITKRKTSLENESKINLEVEENSIKYLKILPSTCGGIYNLNASYMYFLSSPGYPDSYEINRKCIYLIKAPESNRIKIDFLDIRIEANTHQELCNDYLEIRYFQVSQPGPKFCGDMLHFDSSNSITSYKNDTMLIFYSDWANISNGFKLKIEII